MSTEHDKLVEDCDMAMAAALLMATLIGDGRIRLAREFTEEERAARRKARNDAALAELRAQEERDRPIIEAAAAKRARKSAKRRALLSPNEKEPS